MTHPAKLTALSFACLAITLAGCGGGGDSTTTNTTTPSTGTQATTPTTTQSPIVPRNTILSGTTDPGPSVGNDGDFYINTATWMIFGPKANGVWPAGVSLAGPPGTNGAKGATGATGNTGAAGNTILSGSTDPTDSVGNNGDYYINTATSTLFGPKANGKWPPGVSLVGPAGPSGSPGAPGANGSTVLSGTGAPSDTIGNNGDFYLDTNTWTIYGPKANGAWPTGVSLISQASSGSSSGGSGGSGSDAGGHILSGSGAPTDNIGANGDFYLDTSTSTLYGPKTGGTWPVTGVTMTTGTNYSGSFNVPDTLSRGAYVMTGDGGAVPLPNDFGVTIPYDCSSVTLTATTLGKPIGMLNLAVFKVTGSGASATFAPVSGLSCKISNGQQSCNAQGPSGSVKHDDKLQVQLDNNQATGWGGLSVNLKCSL
jgi:hypothetical protein